jgi:hypothetical protein
MSSETWVNGHLISTEARETTSHAGRFRFSVKVDGNPLRDRGGRVRTFATRVGAHKAGLRSLGAWWSPGTTGPGGLSVEASADDYRRGGGTKRD